MIANDLKESLIQFAVSGGFGLNDSSDTPIEVDYYKTVNNKKNYKGPRKKFKDIDRTEVDSIDFEIPKGWILTRLGNIVTYINGYSFTSSETKKGGSGLPVIKSQNIGKKIVEINQKTDFVENPSKKMLLASISYGDLLMVMSSQSSNVNPLGVTAYYDLYFDSLLNQRVLSIRCIESSMSRFLYYYLNSFKFHYELSHKSGGSAQANLKIGHIMEMPVVLPPLLEQKRIVEKLDEILPLIDSLEKDEIKLNDLMQQFPDRMIKSVIKDAILGKIIDEIDNIGNANEELFQIFGKKVEFVNKEDFPYDLPENWALIKHNSLIDLSGGSQPPKSYFSTSPKEGYVRLYQIRDYGDFPQPVYIPLEKASKKTIKGDILVARYGGSLGKIFVAEDGAYNVAMAKAIQKKQFLHNRYLMYYYKSDLFQSVITSFTRSAQPGFNKDNLNDLLLPVPPYNVQVEIVEKLDTIIPLIGNLNNE